MADDLDSEMRSRVARAVEQLEPSDVIALREVSRAQAGSVVQQARFANGVQMLIPRLTSPTGIG